MRSRLDVRVDMATVELTNWESVKNDNAPGHTGASQLDKGTSSGRGYEKWLSSG
jgi:hypothetical protein